MKPPARPEATYSSTLSARQLNRKPGLRLGPVHVISRRVERDSSRPRALAGGEAISDAPPSLVSLNSGGPFSHVPPVFI
jgi:hypothetical protein